MTPIWPESGSEGHSETPPADVPPGEFARALVEFGEITQVYRLLPHERWAAQRLLKNVYSLHPQPSRITKKDGVIGCVGTGILHAWGFPSTTLGMFGLLLLFASGGAYWANALILVAIAGDCVDPASGYPDIPGISALSKVGGLAVTSSANTFGLGGPGPHVIAGSGLATWRRHAPSSSTTTAP